MTRPGRRVAALLLAVLLILSGRAIADETEERIVKQVAAKSEAAVNDTAGLLSPADRAELEKLAAEISARGLKLRFVTVSDAASVDRLQSRLGDLLSLGPKDVLVIAGRAGAHCRAPALKGEAHLLADAFQQSRKDFALGTLPGMKGLANRAALLVEGRLQRESTLARAGAGGLALAILVAALLLARSMLGAAGARNATDAAERQARLDAVSALLYELGVATEERDDGHPIFLEAWRRYIAVKGADGSSDIEQLRLFVRETLDRLKGRA